jgi:hypothetical protein
MTMSASDLSGAIRTMSQVGELDLVSLKAADTGQLSDTTTTGELQ